MSQQSQHPVGKSIRFAIISAATAAALASSVHAGTVAIWDGAAPAGTSTSWGVPANWHNALTPPAGADVVMGTGFNSGLSISLAGASPVGIFEVKANQSFTITADPGAPSQPLQIDHFLRHPTSVGTQTIQANVHHTGTTRDWDISGTGALAISGVLSGEQLKKRGEGLLVLSGANTHERTTVNRGTLQISADINLGAAAGTLTLDNGAVRPIGGVSFDRPLHVSGTGTIDVAAGTTYVQGGLHGTGILVKTGPGRIRLFGGALNADIAKVINMQGQFLTNYAHLRSDIENHGELQLSQTSAGSYTTNISGPGYVLIGGGSISFSGNNSFTGGMTINDTHVAVSADKNLGAGNGTVTLNNNLSVLRMAADFSSNRPFVFNTATNTINYDNGVSALRGPMTGPGTLVKIGTGEIEVTNVRTGGLIVNGGGIGFAFDGTPAGTGSVSIIATSGPTSQIDLANNHLIVDHAAGDGGAAFENVQSLIAGGRNGGAWNGGGIISSIARTDAPGTTGLGMIASSDYAPDTFGGLPVDESSVLVKYTRLGDANLDSTANIQDFALLAANFNQSAGWSRGDFNYDGQANISDFALLAANFNQSIAGSGLPRPGAVPEPAGLLLAAAVGVAARRRRR